MSTSALSPRQAGATLTELLIAIAVVGVVMGGLTQMFATYRRVYAVQDRVAGMTQQGQAAFELISREVRAAGSNPTGATFTAVAYSPTQLELRSDRNGNGTTNDANEHVIYAYDATNRRITRDAGNGVETVAENIQGFTFTYLNSAGATTTVSSAVRQINLTITARTAVPDPRYKTNGGYRTMNLTSLIALRN